MKKVIRVHYLENSQVYTIEEYEKLGIYADKKVLYCQIEWRGYHYIRVCTPFYTSPRVNHHYFANEKFVGHGLFDRVVIFFTRLNFSFRSGFSLSKDFSFSYLNK